MADLTRVAEVLAEHGLGHIAVVGDDAWCATCDRSVARLRGHCLTDEVVAGHQAEALAAAGLLPTETEWGVRWANGQIVGPVTEAEAHAWKSGVPVRREVTEWRPADE